MRLAFVLNGGLHPSGREQIIPAYLALLATLARRHEVHAFVLRHLPAPQSYVLQGIHVHDLGRPWAPFGAGRLAQFLALQRAMRPHTPFHVVHGIWGNPGLLAVLAARRCDARSLVTCDSGEFASVPAIGYGLQRTWHGRATMQTVQRLATRLHVCTEHSATLALAAGCQTRPEVVPLGIGASALRHDTARPAGPPWRLLQVASLNRVKDQGLLIDALAVLGRTHDVYLDLVGEDTLSGALQARAQARGVADRVVFHGFRDQQALIPLRQQAHLYVQTSHHEGAGVSVLEAAAAGLATLGTRVGYVADWAPAAAAAIDSPSPDTLAAAIAALLDQPARRESLARAAQQVALAHDVAWSAAALERIYQAMVVG